MSRPPKASKPALPPYVVRRVDDLIPYALNSRTHSERQIDLLAGSIKEFGFTNPILVDGENGVLAGHGRLLAARKLGLVEVPTIDLAHLTPAQRRAYVIADNRLAEVGSGWDMDMLVSELGILQQEEGFDLGLIGYDQKDLDALLNGWEPDMDKIDKVPADDAPLLATLKVKCPQEAADAVEKVVREAIEAAGLEGVEVG